MGFGLSVTKWIDEPAPVDVTQVADAPQVVVVPVESALVPANVITPERKPVVLRTVEQVALQQQQQQPAQTNWLLLIGIGIGLYLLTKD